MIILNKNKIVTITGGANSTGSAWWFKSGVDLKYIGLVNNITPLVLGPYISDAFIDVRMDEGTYSFFFNTEGDQVPTAQVTGGAGSALSYHEHTIAGNYTMMGDKNVVGINKTSSAETTVIVSMASLIEGVLYTVKDEKGDCDIYNITVIPDSGTIEGLSSYILNNQKQAVTFFKSGTELIVIG